MRISYCKIPFLKGDIELLLDNFCSILKGEKIYLIKIIFFILRMFF